MDREKDSMYIKDLITNTSTKYFEEYKQEVVKEYPGWIEKKDPAGANILMNEYVKKIAADVLKQTSHPNTHPIIKDSRVDDTLTIGDIYILLYQTRFGKTPNPKEIMEMNMSQFKIMDEAFAKAKE